MLITKVIRNWKISKNFACVFSRPGESAVLEERNISSYRKLINRDVYIRARGIECSTVSVWKWVFPRNILCESRRRRGRQRMRWLDSVIEATKMNLTKLQEAVEDRRA